MENEKITKTAGRPYKMERWLQELKNVLETKNLIFLTDKDIQFLVNKNLPKEDRITDRTFENWKAGKFAPNEQIGEDFMECLHDALIKQRDFLGDKLMNDKTSQWTRWAWILERKFEELNLKKISEKVTRQEQSLTLNITAGDHSQIDLINRIVNSDYTDYTEVEPTKIEAKPTYNENDEDVPF